MLKEVIHSEEPVAGNLHGGFCGGCGGEIPPPTRHRVNHDKLMGLLSKRIADKRTLKLIRSYLNSGIMEGGLSSPRQEGLNF